MLKIFFSYWKLKTQKKAHQARAGVSQVRGTAVTTGLVRKLLLKLIESSIY